MKLIQINTVCNGSTGKIMGDIQRIANKEGFETLSFYGRRKGFKDLKCEKIGGFFSFWFHVFLTMVFDAQGYGSYFKTRKLVRRLKKENPDIIHLHNIHGYYLNHKILFNYLKNEYDGKVFWTFHDCWPITGHCAYFTAANCDKWKNQCYRCPNKRKYPISLFKDNSSNNYIYKKNLFNGLNNLTIITPSYWLNNIIKNSYLKKYNVVTINNGIDMHHFQNIKDPNIRMKYNIPNKRILLGVASVWEERKGLNDFIELSKRINNQYIIVLVGLNKRQKNKLKKYDNIIAIERTENQTELVKLYSISYLFLNLTYEDNYPTVNLEAIACGTPVISYDTGGCKEQIDKNTGLILRGKNITNLYEKIINFDITFNNKEFRKKYDKNVKYYEIIKLYKYK